MPDHAIALHRAVFLDRDGTINEEVGYLRSLGQLAVFPWSAEAIRDLNRAGIKVVVVTNQSGIARGYFDEHFVRQVHRRLQDLLGRKGAFIDAFYYCPHHPTEGIPPYRKVCSCRKPEAGMLLQAARDLQIDLLRSYMVGDMMKDVQTGQRVGAKGILVETGYGSAEKLNTPPHPDYTAATLLDAVSWILEDLDR